MIIGITGTISAGKGTIADYLVEKGFKHYSVRDFLLNEIKERGMPETRESMVLVANELREEFGASYIVEKLYAMANGKNAVIESIRCVGEVMALRKKKDFVLFAADAEIKLRYDRAVKRENMTDDITFEKFVEEEEREINNTDINKQNLLKCIELADYVFINEDTIEELQKKIEGVLNEIK